MTMHPDFPNWYRPVTVNPVEGLIQKRWDAVEAFSKRLTTELIRDLLKLFILPRAASTPTPDALAAAFREHDENFPTRDNSQELRVLTGAILREAMMTPGSNATKIALGLACGFFANRSAVGVEREHVDFARSYLMIQSKALRGVPKPAAITVPAFPKERYAELLPASLLTQATIQQLHEPLFAALMELHKGYESGFQKAQASFNALWLAISSQREEINLLWWLQNAFSKHLEQPFQSVGPAAGTLVFPMELADLTEIVPGPDALFGLLLSALQKSGLESPSPTVTLAEAVNSAPRAWRERMVVLHNAENVGELCPILLAIKLSLSTDGAEEWFPVYRKASDVACDLPITATELSMQIYRERLFVRGMVGGNP